MAPRRSVSNNLSPPDVSPSSPGGYPSSPRSASPSNGFTQIFTKPTKWFNRSNSGGVGRSSISSSEPRSSTSSTRKHKISHPTDPRPIMDSLVPPTRPGIGMHAASRSVVDLSLARTTTAIPDSIPMAVRTPSSPSQPVVSQNGLGDLRSISRKPWSKSADDLGKLSPTSTSPKLTPIDTSLHQKIRSYRSDSVTSSAAPSSSPMPSPSTASFKMGYPFPVLPAELSTSPPKSTWLGPPSTAHSSPITPPLTPLTSTSSSPGQTTRSHARFPSNTPRLPSKLSEKLIPPSPKRKGSSSSDRDVEREKGSSGSGASGRSPFPFGFGGGNMKVSPSALSLSDEHGGVSGTVGSTLLAPPTIIEPDGGGDKRSSQMVHRSGFINRMVDFSPAMVNSRAQQAYMAGGASLVLSKGWKPFKLVMKGSKLYFYKPPSDRSAGIRELFPTELVAVLEDETGDALASLDIQDAEMDMDSRGGGKGKEREEIRRRRAYWGRGTHPALVVGTEVEKGTLEALVHEAVFASTFVISEPEGGARYRPEWREFASAVLLCMPALVGKMTFETELLRCASNLVNGADDGARAEEAERVRWLAEVFLDYHGSPANQTAWDLWWRETMPDSAPRAGGTGARLPGVPQSSSTRAMHVPSPQIPAGLGTEEQSPNLGTFSPRPDENSKMRSIIEALSDTVPPRASSLSPEALRKTLEEEGLSRDLLLSLDPALIARSLSARQKDALQKIPDNFTADYLLGPGPQDSVDSLAPTHSLTPFLGSDDRPHWLARLVLIQVLVPEPAGTTHMLMTHDGRNPPATRGHSRSEVISAWVRIGEIARRAGDECTWRAIMSALCSRPIARLDKVWKRVDAEALVLAQVWVQILVRGDQPTPTAPLVYPWAGDAERDIREALDRARSGEDEAYAVSCLYTVQKHFDRTRTTFVLCASQRNGTDDGPESPSVEVLATHWKLLSFDGENRGLAAKFLRIDQFMSLSFAAEPRKRGLFEPYFWSRLSQQVTFHPLSALLFPEPLPSVSFINRGHVIRGRFESNASLNIQEIRDLRLQSDCERSRKERSKLGGFDLGGTVISVKNGELLLLVQPSSDASSGSRPASRAPSRPPSRSANDSPGVEKAFSRTPSIRVTPGSSHGHGTERKSSLVRRNSLPSMSQRTSLVLPEVSSERPLRVVVQAGTLERLVDVLVHGLQGVTVSVADDNGEMPLTDRKTREVRVDMEDFSQIWWNVFRSFVTPQVFFELLRKRYSGTHQPAQALTPEDVSHVVRLRMQVLETISEWITQGGGAQDALDDVVLLEGIQTFMTQPTELRLVESVPDQDSDASQALKALELTRKTLSMCFRSQTMRPIPRASQTTETAHESQPETSYSSDIPHIDRVDAEELVNHINSMVSATVRNITQEDLFTTAELFELQSADRTGWFLTRDPSSIADEVEVQSMNSYVLEVEPSPLISELTQDSLYRLLPPSVRSCIRAFGILRKWLISKLVSNRLGIHARQQRMELILRAIEVARIRSSDTENADLPLPERPCVRSFVEAILTSAVLSVESRTYQRAWLGVAVTRGTGCDTLAAYLAKPVVDSVSSRGTLTADIGWLMEKMLEIISLPDVLESPTGEKVILVNFEKRRSLQTLLANATGVTSGRKQRRRESDRREFERLNNMEKELSAVHFDIRVVREDAHREAMQFPIATGKRGKSAFQLLITQQQEKNRRDRLWRDRLSKEKRAEQEKHDRREEQLNRAMNQRRQTPVMPKQHRNKKSMSSAFFQLMRPISSAFTSETMSGSPVKRTRAELDFVPSHKPSLVVSVVDARVAPFINNERSFVFQIDSEDGGHYLLQAANRQDMRNWIETIERVSKMTAKRRLTYLGQNVKPSLSEDLLAKPAVAARDPVAVFGVDLEFLLQREAPDGEVQPRAVPLVLERLIDEVERRGLTEMGIYRIAGAHSEVNALRDALNRGEWPISDMTDINAVCDLIKSWFRVLPGGLFPTESYGRIISVAGRDDIDLATRVADVRNVVHGLPLASFDLLKRIIEHLEKVTDYEESNQMTAESLSTVFAPNLLRSTNSDVGTFFANMSAGHRATKILITHFHIIFDDVEPEAEADHDHDEIEFDEPIPEEDEEDEEMFRDALDGLPPKLPAEPPVLSVNLGSPASLSFNIP